MGVFIIEQSPWSNPVIVFLKGKIVMIYSFGQYSFNYLILQLHIKKLKNVPWNVPHSCLVKSHIQYNTVIFFIIMLRMIFVDTPYTVYVCKVRMLS